MLFRQTGYHFEDFVETTSKIHTKEHLFDVFVPLMRHLGYDRLNFSVKYDDQLPNSEHKFGIVSTYPEDWQRFYDERRFVEIDPVLQCAAGSVSPYTWKQLETALPLSTKQTRFLRLGEEAGLHNGIGIPFSGPHSQVAGIALATSSRSRDRPSNFALLVAYCNQFYATFKRIVGLCGPTFPRFARLSCREHEVLRWVVCGKTDDEISTILSISDHTVNRHMRTIFLKLGVNNRLNAVVTAITTGLINL